MCIYCGTSNYRKIYENHTGAIPIDNDGRTYEIHHIDGNHSNNEPSNLKAVTIQEHYDIHYSQGDYGACWFILSQRLSLPPEEKSEIARLNALRRVANGTHPFLDSNLSTQTQLNRVAAGTHHFLDGNISRKTSARRIADRSHHLLGGKIQRMANQQRVANGSHHFLGERNPVHKKIENGTHHFLGGEISRKITKQRIETGTHNFLGPVDDSHPTQFKWSCPHCGKSGKGKSLFNRWHGDRCKKKT